jgi:hypothetical protein
MDTSMSTAPVTGARFARALTYLVYAFVLVGLVMLLLGFFLLSDRIAQMGYAG